MPGDAALLDNLPTVYNPPCSRSSREQAIKWARSDVHLPTFGSPRLPRSPLR